MLLSKEWWALSFRWLFGKKIAGAQVRNSSYLIGSSLWIALLSCAMGVGALSFVRALVTGFESQFSVGVADAVGLAAYKTGWRSDREHQWMAEKFNFPVESYWQGQALLVGPMAGKGIVVEGRKSWSETQTCGPATVPQISMGKTLADNLGVGLGSNLKMLLPGLVSGSFTVRVSAIRGMGFQELDARRAVLDDSSLRCYLTNQNLKVADRPGDYIGMKFFPPFLPDNEKQLNLLKANIESEARKVLRDSDPDVRTWREMKQNFFRGLGFDRTVLSVVLGFLTLAASLNVAAALFMIFFERDKDMLTLRALGMAPNQMTIWITLQGFIIGILGSALGMASSWLVAEVFQKWKIISLPAEVYHLDHLVFRFTLNEQVGVFLFGVGSALLISVGVALLLSRMKILEVLGHRR